MAKESNKEIGERALPTNTQKIVRYLLSIAPHGASNSEIARQTGVSPHQQVFMITRQLMNQGKIRGVQGIYGEREWVFYFIDNHPGDLPTK
ncbi:MAG: hypothetical protein PHQ40_02175 [Anaerolineaceae bacterium]|nr:hypothetical protein [Anaerolineaceae bacterium]